MFLDTEQAPPHCMTYEERESLKQFARAGKGLPDALIMIAHWMRCQHDVSFTAYASNWAVAQNGEGVSAIRDQWPLRDSRMIADGETTWGSFLKKE